MSRADELRLVTMRPHSSQKRSVRHFLRIERDQHQMVSPRIKAWRDNAGKRPYIFLQRISLLRTKFFIDMHQYIA